MLTGQRQRAVNILSHDFKMDEHEVVDHFALSGVTIFLTDVNRVESVNNICFLTYRGETKVLSQWAEERKINAKTLHDRIYKLKWPIEKALTLRVRKRVDNTSEYARGF